MAAFFTISFTVGGVVASLVEYWVHVLMHRGIFLSRTQFNHHREPEGGNWLKQFVYFLLGGAIPWFGVLLGLGFMAGCIAWAAWVADAHEWTLFDIQARFADVMSVRRYNT
jgi:hypothetical protein